MSMSQKISIHFTKSGDYRVVAANGAWGGISPNGDIIFDLFIEKTESPELLELEVMGPGMINELNRVNQKIVREAQVGAVVRPDIAYSIGRWLIDKAREAGYNENQPVDPVKIN
jgi:hypothetical protein